MVQPTSNGCSLTQSDHQYPSLNTIYKRLAITPMVSWHHLYHQPIQSIQPICPWLHLASLLCCAAWIELPRDQDPNLAPGHRWRGATPCCNLEYDSEKKRNLGEWWRNNIMMKKHTWMIHGFGENNLLSCQFHRTWSATASCVAFSHGVYAPENSWSLTNRSRIIDVYRWLKYINQVNGYTMVYHGIP